MTFFLSHHPDARGGSQGSGNRSKDGYDEVYDFLDDFFFHSGLGFRIVDDLFGFLADCHSER